MVALGVPEEVPCSSTIFTKSSPSKTLPNTTWRPCVEETQEGTNRTHSVEDHSENQSPRKSYIKKTYVQPRSLDGGNEDCKHSMEGERERERERERETQTETLAM
jgi:hypothetical protein